MEYKEIMVMQFINPDTGDIVGADIIGYVKASSYHIASVRDHNEALEWAYSHNVPVNVVSEYADMHGDTPVFNVFKSELYTEVN